MDESWRMTMGLNVDPFFSAARKSMNARIHAEDFSDVFGGPPQSVLTGKFSGDDFYGEIFRPSVISSGGFLSSSKSHRKNLPTFRIPSGGDGFYDGVFGGAKKEEPMKQSRWLNSLSEDVSSSFTSNLRPLNVPSRSHERESKKQSFPTFPEAGDYFDYSGLSRRASPETISLDTSSFRRIDDYGPSSPTTSPVSSFVQRTTGGYSFHDEGEDEDEEEMMSSYVIEINPYRYGGNSDSNDMDEAIAWAKERSQRPEVKLPEEEEDVIDSRRSENEGKSEEEAEIEMKEEEIRIWLAGKETNIRLLLSTLHHVLWSNNNWQAIPLANLRDGSQVKRAYQKARLCLHPDKLQQRGDTSPIQRSVASKVFSILQEAWVVYATNEGLSS